MADFDIAAAMASIPSKLANLRKSFEALNSSPSFNSSSSLQWQHIEDHFTGIQNHIQSRLQTLQQPKINPRLKSICSNSDGPALFPFCLRSGRQWPRTRRDLSALLPLVPAPATLALDFIDAFRRWAADDSNTFQLKVACGCLDILEHVSVSGAEIDSEISEKARIVAREWIDNFGGGRGIAFVSLVFCKFLIVYRLISESENARVLDVILRVLQVKEGDDVWKRFDVVYFGKKFSGVAEFFMSLGLHQNISELMQSLKTHGKHLEAVKLVCTLNLSDQYPVVLLLDEFLKDCTMTADGNNNTLQEMAIEKEIAAARAVIETVEEYKLESVYPCEVLKERIKQLDSQNETRKEETPAVGSPSSFSDAETPHQQQKRPRLDDVP